MATYTRNPDELWNMGSKEMAGAVVAAISSGNWQIDGDTLYIIDARNQTIHTAPRGGVRQAGYEFAASENEFTFEPSSFEYFIVAAPTDTGRNDLATEFNRRIEQMARMIAEAAADPEGAFGGRGNNVTIGWR